MDTAGWETVTVGVSWVVTLNSGFVDGLVFSLICGLTIGETFSETFGVIPSFDASVSKMTEMFWMLDFGGERGGSVLDLVSI